MDSATRFSAGFIVEYMKLSSSILAFETCWVSQFWIPGSVHAYDAFNRTKFRDYLTSHNIAFRPVPPRRHRKNAIESKNGIIRSIFLRLNQAALVDPTQTSATDTRLLVLKYVSISNDLYGSEICSAFELAKGFTKPLTEDGLTELPEDLREAHVNLQAKRKLTLILRSKATIDQQLSAGDSVNVYKKNQMQKRGKWLSSLPILSIDLVSGSICVPGANGRTITAAIEDVRPEIHHDTFAEAVQDGLDDLDSDLSEMFLTSVSPNRPVHDYVHEIVPPDPATPAPDVTFEGSGYCTLLPSTGDMVEFFWALANAFYPGNISSISDAGHFVINYDDGEVETVNLIEDTWRFKAPDTVSALTSLLPELQTDQTEVLDSLFSVFGNRSFLFHKASGFPRYTLSNAFSEEDTVFRKFVTVIPAPDVHGNSNIISSHTIYKI